MGVVRCGEATSCPLPPPTLRAQYVEVWIRTDAATTRNTRWEMYIGYGQDYRTNTRCTVPSPITAGGGGKTTLPCVATGRFLQIRRPFLLADENVLTICGA
jgi:hypothetical protein